MIRAAMAQLDLTEGSGILLVGDRKYDAIGAADCGIPCLGFDYCGFAPEGELEDAGTVAIVHTAEAIVEYILNRT